MQRNKRPNKTTNTEVMQSVINHRSEQKAGGGSRDRKKVKGQQTEGSDNDRKIMAGRHGRQE